MKTSKACILAALSLGPLLALSSPAASQEAGFYLGFSGAVTGADTRFDYATGTDDADYDIGWGVSGFAGYDFGNGLRTELELGFRQNNVSNIDTSIDKSDGGETRADLAMVNVIYGFENESRFTPYLGAGVGIAHVSHGLVQSVAGDTVHDDYVAPAGQAIAGVSVDLNPHWKAFADYRFLATTSQGTINSGGVDVDSRFRSQTVNFGLLRKF